MHRFQKCFQGLFSENTFLMSHGKEGSVEHRSNKAAVEKIALNAHGIPL